MLRSSTTQKQYEIFKRNEIMPGFSLEHSNLEPSSVIKTMMKIIKTKSNDSMDMETRIEFFKIADAVVRMVEEIRE